MSLDLDRVHAAVARHGRVVRVLVVETRGSVPRGPGTDMLVWDNGQEGTIGGGALEWEATQAALKTTSARVLQLPLGPGLGQCCGGAVTLALEPLDAERLASLTVENDRTVRRIDGPEAVPPALSRAAAGPLPLAIPRLVDGWLLEPVFRAGRALWVHGAGHVGRAVVSVMAPLPDWRVTWLDTADARFPATVPDGIAAIADPDMPARLAEAPAEAHHLILTYSHALDLALCHAALTRGFGWCGLIGSATKWARFRSRLIALGHTPASLDRIACPIGNPALGKHPQAIAIGVAAALLSPHGAVQHGCTA